MGLVIFAVMGAYLLLAIFVVTWAIRFARKNNKSVKRWGWGAALMMYLIPFWDWIPTVATHQYYCATEAGFWVYKTPEQWRRENPGVMETLPAPGPAGSPTKYEEFDDGHGHTLNFLMSERFNWVVTTQDNSYLLPIIREEQVVKDVQKNEVLARYVDFAAGNSIMSKVGPPGPLKFWLRNHHCIGGAENEDVLRSYRDHFYGSKN